MSADDKTARTETAGLRVTDNVFFKTLFGVDED
jgi:hypothetical protein